jgi:hypothetical protein
MNRVLQGIQVSKVLADGTTACYVGALNRSMATDASSIPDVAPKEVSSFISLKNCIDSTFYLHIDLILGDYRSVVVHF